MSLSTYLRLFGNKSLTYGKGYWVSDIVMHNLKGTFSYTSFTVTVIEFDEYLLKLGRFKKIGHDLNLSHKN